MERISVTQRWQQNNIQTQMMVSTERMLRVARHNETGNYGSVTVNVGMVFDDEEGKRVDGTNVGTVTMMQMVIREQRHLWCC